MNFLKSQGKSLKVSEKSGNSFFRFIVHKFSSRLWNTLSFGKDEKYAAKQAKRSIWHSTPDLCNSCGQWFSLWMISSQFLLPLSAKSGKRLKMKRKMSMACKETKANVDIDYFSLIKGQWKLFKVHWKVRNKSGNFQLSDEWQPCTSTRHFFLLSPV